MKKTMFHKVLVTAGLITVLAIGFCQGQNNPNRQAGRMGFNSEQMQERMISWVTTDLKLTSDEAKVVVPKIKKLMQIRFSARQEMMSLGEKLAEVLKADKPSAKQIKPILAQIKNKAQETKVQVEAAEKDLKAVITLEQEARLTLAGILNEGVGMGMMGGRGGMMGRGGFGGPGGNRGQRPGGQPQDNQN